ncbi:MAG: hypothetical protein ACRCUE_14215, partial [Bosea sp. (in: a-proteobacteria)]
MTDLKVLEGRDGYLFLTNDTNGVIDQVEGSYPFDADQLDAIAMVHAARRAFCGHIGARYDHVVVPDRENCLTQFLPDAVVPGRFGLRPLMRYQEAGLGQLHPLLYDTTVLTASSMQPFLFRRDTHWTWDGAFNYLRALVPALGLDPSKLDIGQFVSVSYENAGDLGSKLGCVAEPSRFMHHPALTVVHDNGAPNTGRVRMIHNANAPPGTRMLVLHDSFGEWLTT